MTQASKKLSHRKTLLQHLDQFPPFLVYQSALRNTNLKTLTSRCGIPARTLARIAVATSYRNFKIQLIDSFLFGCGISLYHQGIIHRQRIRERIIAIKKKGFPKMNRIQREAFDERCRKLV